MVTTTIKAAPPTLRKTLEAILEVSPLMEVNSQVDMEALEDVKEALAADGT